MRRSEEVSNMLEPTEEELNGPGGLRFTLGWRQRTAEPPGHEESAAESLSQDSDDSDLSDMFHVEELGASDMRWQTV